MSRDLKEVGECALLLGLHTQRSQRRNTISLDYGASDYLRRLSTTLRTMPFLVSPTSASYLFGCTLLILCLLTLTYNLVSYKHLLYERNSPTMTQDKMISDLKWKRQTGTQTTKVRLRGYHRSINRAQREKSFLLPCDQG